MTGNQTTVIRNISTLITMDPAVGQGDLGVLHQATIEIVGDTITSIATGHERSIDGPFDTEIDASGLIAIPGLVNAHHHLYQGILRGLGANEDLVGWFRARAPYLERYSSDTRFHAVRLSLLECIESGVTTVFEFASNTRDYHDVAATVRATAQLPVRMVLGYQPPSQRDPNLEPVIALSRTGNSVERLFCVPGAVIPGRDDDSQRSRFVSLVEQAREHALGISTHVLEHAGERQNGGVSFLHEIDALGRDTVLAHCIHLLPSDIELLGDTDTRVVYNPMSNMRLGSGVMPLRSLHEAGVHVALGSDGATADSGDFFCAMRSGIGLQRAFHGTPNVCSYERILRMATLEGAEALGIADRVGSIAVGKCGDIVLLDPHSASFGCGVDAPAQVVFSAHPRNVHTVVLGGKPVLRNGAVVNIDAAEIVAGASQAAQRVFGSLGQHA